MLRKTTARSIDFLRCAINWRSYEGQFAPSVWLLAAGAIYLLGNFAHDSQVTSLVAGLGLLVTLVGACAIDARFGIIPDSFVFLVAAGGALLACLSGVLEQRIVESFVALGLLEAFRISYRWFRGIEGLGFGDVKLLAAATFWVGLSGLPLLLIIAVLSAGTGLLILKVQGVPLSAKQAIAFGPHLASGLWLGWLVWSLQGGLYPS